MMKKDFREHVERGRSDERSFSQIAGKRGDEKV
jgi:hypothetical protein